MAGARDRTRPRDKHVSSLRVFCVDPRFFQITVLSVLLYGGVILRDFPVSFTSAAYVLVACLATQLGLRAFLIQNHVPLDYKSTLVTALSLCLLFRADLSTFAACWPYAAAAFLAIASKFLIRWRAKHVFNPANFAIVILLLTGHGWVTPGQWGSLFLSGLILAAVGIFVTHKATRLDIPFYFLSIYAGLLFARAAWLGDPFSIPLLNLQNGALLVFTFFMLPDPKTTPNHGVSRLVFAAATAILGYYFQYCLYISDGLFYALFLVCLLTPVMDILFHASVYQWPNHYTTSKTGAATCHTKK